VAVRLRLRQCAGRLGGAAPARRCDGDEVRGGRRSRSGRVRVGRADYAEWRSVLVALLDERKAGSKRAGSTVRHARCASSRAPASRACPRSPPSRTGPWPRTQPPTVGIGAAPGKSTLVDGSRRANVVGGGCVLFRAVMLAGYSPSELSKRLGERRRDRKSTRAAAPCATSGSAANVRPTGSSSTLVAPLDLGIAARLVEGRLVLGCHEPGSSSRLYIEVIRRRLPCQ